MGSLKEFAVTISEMQNFKMTKELHYSAIEKNILKMPLKRTRARMIKSPQQKLHRNMA